MEYKMAVCTEPSWADTMSDQEDEVEEGEGPTDGEPTPTGNDEGEGEAADNICDQLLCKFPVPGELFVHLFTYSRESHVQTSACCSRTPANYYTSLLDHHPPPMAGEPPYLVNSWQSSQTPSAISPFRVQYGTNNPAVHGIVITSQSVVPNFSWTPRLALDSETMDDVLSHPDWQGHPSMLMVPAVHGRMVRLFQQGNTWYIASNKRVETLLTTGHPHPQRQKQHHDMATSAMGVMFATCLVRYYASGVGKFVGELNPPGMVWFFAMFPETPTLLFIGTCPMVSLRTLRLGAMQHLDLSFRVHAFLPPAVPLLPDSMPNGARMRMLRERLHNLHTMTYTDLYDGMFVANTQTMFAVRLCYPATKHLVCRGACLRSFTSRRF